MSKARALSWAADGALPPSEDLVLLRAAPAEMGWRLQLTVDYADGPPATIELPFAEDVAALDEDGAFGALLLFVKGPEPLPAGFGLPWVRVVDVGEETTLGHAPSLHVRGSGGVVIRIGLGEQVEAPRRGATVLELASSYFERDSAVLHAEGLDALAVILRQAQRHRGKRLLVAGHADTAGSRAHNEALSGLRAAGVLALLTGDHEGWAAVAAARHQPVDVERALRWLGSRGGVWSGATTSAALRQAFAASLGPARKAPPRDRLLHEEWRLVYQALEERLAELLDTSVDGLEALRSGLSLVPPGSVGCGESFPLDRWRSGGASDRRVDVILFDAAEAPDLGACHAADRSCRPGACPLYGVDRWDVRRLDTDASTGATRAHDLVWTLEDDEGRSIPDVAYRATFGDGTTVEGRLGSKGRGVIVEPPPGAVTIEYLDPDDVLAKAEAARLHDALVRGDRQRTREALAHSPEVMARIVAAYARETGGGRLVDDVLARFGGDDDDDVVALLAMAHLRPRGGRLLLLQPLP